MLLLEKEDWVEVRKMNLESFCSRNSSVLDSFGRMRGITEDYVWSFDDGC